MSSIVTSTKTTEQRKRSESLINAKFQLSLCRTCLGCYNLEDMEYAGVTKCNSYRRSSA